MCRIVSFGPPWVAEAGLKWLPVEAQPEERSPYSLREGYSEMVIRDRGRAVESASIRTGYETLEESSCPTHEPHL